MSEILFTSIISVAILLQLMIICRAVVDLRAIAGMLGVAFLIGIAALVRPIGQVLLIVVPLAVVPLSTISLKKRIILSMLVLSIPVGVIMSWSYRNYRQRGLWTFSTIEAANLNYTLAAGVIAYESGRSIDEVVADRLRLAGRESGPPDLWSKTFDEDPKEMMDRGLQVLLSHPSVTAFIAVKGFLRSWIMPPNRIGLSTFLGHQVDRGEANAFISRNILSTIRSTLSSRWLASIRALLFFQLAVNIFTVIGVGLAVSRAFSARSPDAWLVIIPLVAATLLLLAAAGPGESDRYRVPATPMLALIAAFGWTVGNRREAG